MKTMKYIFVGLKLENVFFFSKKTRNILEGDYISLNVDDFL